MAKDYNPRKRRTLAGGDLFHVSRYYARTPSGVKRKGENLRLLNIGVSGAMVLMNPLVEKGRGIFFREDSIWTYNICFGFRNGVTLRTTR